MKQRAGLAIGVSQQVCFGCLSELLRVSQSTSTDLFFLPIKDGNFFTSLSDFCLLFHGCTDNKRVSSKSFLNAQNTIPQDNKVLGIEIFHSKCGNVHNTNQPCSKPGTQTTSSSSAESLDEQQSAQKQTYCQEIMVAVIATAGQPLITSVLME